MNEFCIYIAHFLCGIIKCALQHFVGDFARLLYGAVHNLFYVTSIIHRCPQNRMSDHNTGNFMPYSFRQVCGFFEHLSSYADVVHTTTKQVISRRRKNENVFKMSIDEICTCKACKNTVFHCQICNFVGFLLPSSSWLLKLPIAETKSYIFR